MIKREIILKIHKHAQNEEIKKILLNSSLITIVKEN